MSHLQALFRIAYSTSVIQRMRAKGLLGEAEEKAIRSGMIDGSADDIRVRALPLALRDYVRVVGEGELPIV